MRKIELRDAKSNLSAIVDQALGGTPFVVTRHGKPQAVILSFEDWRRLSTVPSFGRLLMSAPDGDEKVPKRDRTPGVRRASPTSSSRRRPSVMS